MHRGNTFVPALAVMLSMAAFVAVLAFALWPKAEEVNPTTATVRHKATNTTNTGENTNTAVNVNAVANTNTASDVTAGWKTYTNATIGLSLKYPSGLKVENPCGTTGKLVSSCTSFVNEEGTAITTFVHPSTDIVKAGWFSGVTITSDTTKVINGTTWRIVVTQGSPDGMNTRLGKSAIYSARGISVSLDLNYSADQDETIANYNQMLSTLTVNDPTAGWKTYTNSTDAYTVKYPASWKTFTCTGSTTAWFGLSGPLCDTDAHSDDVTIQKVETGFNLVQSLANEKKNMVDPQQQEVTIAGTTGTRLTGTTKKDPNAFYGGNQYVDLIYVLHGGRYYRLSHSALNGQKLYVAEFEGILSTFTFTK